MIQQRNPESTNNTALILRRTESFPIDPLRCVSFRFVSFRETLCNDSVPTIVSRSLEIQRKFNDERSMRRSFSRRERERDLFLQQPLHNEGRGSDNNNKAGIIPEFRWAIDKDLVRSRALLSERSFHHVREYTGRKLRRLIKR